MHSTTLCSYQMLKLSRWKCELTLLRREDGDDYACENDVAQHNYENFLTYFFGSVIKELESE